MNLDQILCKNVTYDDIKSDKKQSFTLSSDSAFFEIQSQEAYRNSWTLDASVGCWTLEAGLWTLNSGHQTLDSRRWTLDFGRWTLDSGPWTLDAGRWTLDVACYTFDAGLWALDNIFDCFRTKSEASF